MSQHPMRSKPRARDLGVPFEGNPGPANAITDIVGLEVGHVTLIRDVDRERSPGVVNVDDSENRSESTLSVRTGVTAIHPLGKGATQAVVGGWFSLNGNGEMTGTAFLDEFGTVFGPIVLTNTLSVGLARDTVVAWNRKRTGFGHAVAAETWDGQLNDIFGFHVTRSHVLQAIETATGGPVAEGNVGGGTGMTSYQFKSGIGTSSRVIRTKSGPYTLGVLVQSNYGKRYQLKIAGVRVGTEITELMPEGGKAPEPDAPPPPDGSIIAIVATDAPLLPHQLRAVAKRVSLGLGRLGSIAAHSSGDLFLAFSTANHIAYGAHSLHALSAVPSEFLDPLFEATVQASEEAVVNALVAAETMTGAHGRTVHALPHDRLQQVLANYGRLLD